MKPSNERTPSVIRVCKSKKLYDTEFEAELAVAKTEHWLKEEYRVYRCPGTSHYHISHKDKSKSIGHGTQGMTVCPTCKVKVRMKNLEKHLEKHRSKESRDE